MAYFVVLLAALMHAVWNSIIKESNDKLLTLAVIRIVGLVFGLSIILFGPPLNLEAIPYMLGASLIHFLYFWFLLHTYGVGDFSQVYPLSRGSAPLIVLVLSVLVAGETLHLTQIIATVVICLGILMLSFSNPVARVTPLIFAFGTAFCIAGYTVVSGIGVRRADSFLVYAGWLEAVCGLGVVLFIAFQRKQQLLSDIRKQGWAGVWAGLFSIAGFAAALWAFKRAPLGPIAALRETSIIFAAAIGTLVFKEGHAKQRMSAACLVVVGIAGLFILK